MPNELEIFAKRLRQARIKAQLSMEALCERMGSIVSKQAISKYEGAKMMPTSTILIALAEALNVELCYFFRPFTFDLGNFDVSFRKKSSVGVKEVSALKVQIQDDIERYLEIEEILGKEKPVLNNIETGVLKSTTDMEQCAKRVREQWGLGKDGIANVQDLLEANGIKVIYTNAHEGFDGVSGVVNGLHYIIVLNNEKNHTERRRLTSIHELGHLLFNDKFSAELTPHEKENLCNAFANEMLLPSETLQLYFGEKSKIAIEELITLGETFGISVDAIVHKLHNMGLVSEKRYRSFYIRKNQNPLLKKKVEATRYKETKTNRFEAMVYSALAQQLISTSKAASLLNCTINKVRQELDVI
ncbi:MAG: ImmA/IrrE family metallo-endopeptidase [Coprobacter sp.]|nr:ImmA/IrrE family metallo-endopeptidase [Coprobacter sp.]